MRKLNIRHTCQPAGDNPAGKIRRIKYRFLVQLSFTRCTKSSLDQSTLTTLHMAPMSGPLRTIMCRDLFGNSGISSSSYQLCHVWWRLFQTCLWWSSCKWFQKVIALFCSPVASRDNLETQGGGKTSAVQSATSQSIHCSIFMHIKQSSSITISSNSHLTMGLLLSDKPVSLMTPHVFLSRTVQPALSVWSSGFSRVLFPAQLKRQLEGMRRGHQKIVDVIHFTRNDL